MKLDVSLMIVGLRGQMTVEEIARRAGISRNLSGECRRPGVIRSLTPTLVQ